MISSPLPTPPAAGAASSDGVLAAAVRLAADIRRRHRYLLRDLRIEVVAGGVVLHGRAVTFYGKQLAQHEVMRRSFTIVANRIVVGP
jgi:hypothetical protein